MDDMRIPPDTPLNRYTWLVLVVCCFRLSDANASGFSVRSATDEPAKAIISRSASPIIVNGQINKEWDAIWLARTRRTEQGWSAEIAIPFKSLGFHRGQQVWGFNFSRTIKRKLEEDRWASPRLDLQFFQVSEAGEIAGFKNIEQGRGLDVRPYLSNKALRNGRVEY